MRIIVTRYCTVVDYMGLFQKLNVSGRQFGRGQAAWWNDGNVVSNVLGFGGRLQLMRAPSSHARNTHARAHGRAGGGRQGAHLPAAALPVSPPLGRARASAHAAYIIYPSSSIAAQFEGKKRKKRKVHSLYHHWL